MSQLKGKINCPEVTVDILDGKVNTLRPDRMPDEIKERIPCFTTAIAENAGDKCGGSIVYKDKDIVFYTQRDYVEIGEHFKGKLSIPMMGAARNSLFKWLGNPKIKDDNWDAFDTSYGTLVLHYNKSGKVNLIQFSTKKSTELNLCE